MHKHKIMKISFLNHIELGDINKKCQFVTLDFYWYRISFIFILSLLQTVDSENTDILKQVTAKHLDRILKKCIWYDKDVKCQKEKSFVLDVAGCCNRMLHYWSSTITFKLVLDIDWVFCKNEVNNQIFKIIGFEKHWIIN